MRLSETSLRANLSLALIHRGRGGFLGFVDACAMRNNDAPRAARRWISGLFLSASASLWRLGQLPRVEPCVRSDATSQIQPKKGPIHEPATTVELDANTTGRLR